MADKVAVNVNDIVDYFKEVIGDLHTEIAMLKAELRAVERKEHE